MQYRNSRTHGGDDFGVSRIRRLRPLWICLTATPVLLTLFFSGQDAGQSGGLSAALAEWMLSLFRIPYTEAFFDAFHHFLRKAAHFSLYAVFGCGLAGLFLRPGKLPRTAFLSLLTAGTYAASDEFHQRFVAGRAGSWRDVCQDTAGAAVGTALLFLLCRVLNAYAQRHTQNRHTR